MDGMREKALVSLEAAARLLDQGYVDPAASRLYYATFQASVHAYETRLGRRPGDFRLGEKEWRHDLVGGNAALIRGRREDVRFIRALRDLRERADYKPVGVDRETLETRRRQAEEFVREVTA